MANRGDHCQALSWWQTIELRLPIGRERNLRIRGRENKHCECALRTPSCIRTHELWGINFTEEAAMAPVATSCKTSRKSTFNICSSHIYLFLQHIHHLWFLMLHLLHEGLRLRQTEEEKEKSSPVNTFACYFLEIMLKDAVLEIKPSPRNSDNTSP